jgi:hypothetical protein
MSTFHAAKEQRETAKATHSDRAKTRDQERRQQTKAKFDSTYVDSDDGASDSSAPAPRYRYEKRSSTTPRRERDERESRESRFRPTEPSRRRERRYEDESEPDNLKTKFESQAYSAEDYIASKGRSSKSPRPYHGYDMTDPDSSGSRPDRRSRHRSSSRNNSYENLGSPKTYEVKPAKMPSATTAPGFKTHFRPSFLGSRAHTSTSYVRPKREGRERERDSSKLQDMVDETLPSRTKMRDRNDSGYSSPNTPELPRGTSPKTSTRYSIHEQGDHRVVEPKSSSKYRSTRSPERERTSSSARATPKRSTTYQSYMEASPRAEREQSSRSSRPSRTYSGYDVHYIRPKDSNVKTSRAYEPEDISYSRRGYEEDYRFPHMDRRQSVK